MMIIIEKNCNNNKPVVLWREPCPSLERAAFASILAYPSGKSKVIRVCSVDICKCGCYGWCVHLCVVCASACTSVSVCVSICVGEYELNYVRELASACI